MNRCIARADTNSTKDTKATPKTNELSTEEVFFVIFVLFVVPDSFTLSCALLLSYHFTCTPSFIMRGRSTSDGSIYDEVPKFIERTP